MRAYLRAQWEVKFSEAKNACIELVWHENNKGRRIHTDLIASHVFFPCILFRLQIIYSIHRVTGWIF